MYDADKNTEKSIPRQFETKNSTVSKKLGGKVKIKKKTYDITIDSENIELERGEYIKLIGITSVNRIPLFHNNHIHKADHIHSCKYDIHNNLFRPLQHN